MNEEIKEILDYLKTSNKNKKRFEKDKVLKFNESQILLNYITNLQQLYENALKVNQNTEKYRTELESKYVLLQQENERLNSNQDKVIKYIDEHTLFVNGGIIKSILNGSDEE